MKHPLEIFKIKGSEFFSCINRFHLPCVRSYYNGKTCYLTPSSITAYQLLCNIDFRYFIGSYDPINIIDKYRKRGYGIMLNKIEVKQYLSYIMVMNTHKKAYGITSIEDIKNIIGELDISHEFFKPRKNIPEEFAVDPQIKMDYNMYKMDYVTHKFDMTKIYKKTHPKYPTDLLDIRTIDSNGNVSPLKRWMIDAAFDFLK